MYIYTKFCSILPYKKISNNFRSFQIGISKIDWVTPAMSDILNWVRFFYDALQSYRLYNLTK